jgi:tetratricopeptide (TPR) repeat protein
MDRMGNRRDVTGGQAGGAIADSSCRTDNSLMGFPPRAMCRIVLWRGNARRSSKPTRCNGWAFRSGKNPLQHALVSLAAAVWVGLAVPAFGAGEADRAFEQAKLALEGNDYDEAIARLDQAVRLEPKQAKFLGFRGMAWLGKRAYDKGSADLKAAIGLHPDDAGIGYRASKEAKLSASALHHGEQQVVEMLRDRPAMAQFGQKAEFLRQWAARKFAGEDLGTPIDWDPSPPLHSDAEHLAPADDENAAILVAAVYQSGPKQGRPRAFEELWAGAIYELHNVAYASEFVRLNDEAAEGKVSKRAFVAGILKYELRAAQQTRAFYVQVFLPWAEKQKLPTDPTLWFCDWWDTPEGVLRTFTDKSAYPWRPYARTHDWATVHRRWYLGKFTKAFKLLEEMRTEKGYEEDQPEVYYWIGRCLERLGKPAEAITALGEAIRLDPNNAAAYRARGRLFEQLGQKDKAQADLKKAKELEKNGG